ncbi:MAG: hypothetical protein KBD64_06005 [Gammaproteobacteria bacterium]|nr:hypothetical protein [Gammaproteobacteria bacterium]
MSKILFGLILLPGLIFGAISNTNSSNTNSMSTTVNNITSNNTRASARTKTNAETADSLRNATTLQCDYYKSLAATYCRKNYSHYNELDNCTKAYKERWCRCMGYSPDCYKKDTFYW